MRSGWAGWVGNFLAMGSGGLGWGVLDRVGGGGEGGGDWGQGRGIFCVRWRLCER